MSPVKLIIDPHVFDGAYKLGTVGLSHDARNCYTCSKECRKLLRMILDYNAEFDLFESAGSWADWKQYCGLTYQQLSQQDGVEPSLFFNWIHNGASRGLRRQVPYSHFLNSRIRAICKVKDGFSCYRNAYEGNTPVCHVAVVCNPGQGANGEDYIMIYCSKRPPCAHPRLDNVVAHHIDVVVQEARTLFLERLDDASRT
jgi:hypothetical protein